MDARRARAIAMYVATPEIWWYVVDGVVADDAVAEDTGEGGGNESYNTTLNTPLNP